MLCDRQCVLLLAIGGVWCNIGCMCSIADNRGYAKGCVLQQAIGVCVVQ